MLPRAMGRREEAAMMVRQDAERSCEVVGDGGRFCPRLVTFGDDVSRILITAASGSYDGI